MQSRLYAIDCVFLSSVLLLLTVTAAAPDDVGDSSDQLDKYKHRHYSNPHNCMYCRPGWGVAHLCNTTHETECHRCGIEFWTPAHPHIGRCRPCSQCGIGLYEYRRCRSTRDTNCDSCKSPHPTASANADYAKKCQQSVQQMLIDEIQRNRHNHGVPDDGLASHQFWKFDDDDMINNDQPNQSSTPVSTHVIAIFVLVGVLIVLLVAIRLTIRQRSRRDTHGLYANLTKEDNEIIRQCANGLLLNDDVVAKCNQVLSSMPDRPSPNIIENPIDKCTNRQFTNIV